MNAKLKNTIANSPRLVISLLIVAGLVTAIGLYSGSAAAQSQAQINSITTANYAYDSNPWPECDTIPSGGCADGYRYFGIGDEVLFAAEYSAPVTVTGTPTLALDVGGTEKLATFKEIREKSLIFAYTVIEGDEDQNGVSIPAGSINLAGGTINGEGGTAASLSHDGMPVQNHHRIDGVRPRFLGIGKPYGGNDGSDGVYGIGDAIPFPLKFSERVYVRTGPTDYSNQRYYTASPTGPLAPKLRVKVGEKTRYAVLSHESGGPPAHLYFRYYVKKGDHAPNGPAVDANSIKLKRKHTFRDAAGNPVVGLNHSAISTGPNFLIDAVRPKVTGIAITSTPANGEYYEEGEDISVTVSFDESMRALPTSGGRTDMGPDCVDFTDLLPQLRIQVGKKSRIADLADVSGSDVIFSYTVRKKDRDPDGISVRKNSIVLPCGVPLRDDVGTGWGENDAKRKHPAIKNAAGHVVGASTD